MAEGKVHNTGTANNILQSRPSQEALPPTAWLSVADLQVDYSYQHRPYARAIQDLDKNYQVDYSGFILVNERTDQTYWVIDGQTRCAVHASRGYRWIKAEMLRGLSQAEEAEVYLLKCINAKRIPVDFFLAEYVAKRPVAVLIHDILDKRDIAIESYATTQRHRGMNAPHVVTCVSYLKRMIGRDPTGNCLGMTLDLIRDTWEYGGNTLTGLFLDALHKLLLVHAEEIDRKTFMQKLGAYRPEELREQALLLRLGTKPQLAVGNALQRVIIDIYNSGRPAQRRIDLGSSHTR